jgi:flagellar L-ring protein precursor FlgH
MLSAIRTPVLCLNLAVLLALSAIGCGPKTARVTAADHIEQYIRQAKAEPAPQSTDGSLWTDHGRRANLFRDFKARDVNDVVTIRVSESTRAASSADASNARKSNATTGVNHLFGLEKGIKELPNMVGATGDSKYEGQGSTSRNTSITTTLSARVTDVLANGYLVVEGVKEVRLNNENQVVYLRGVVRPEDISPTNIVSSANVGQMELRVQGQGVVSQPLNPGWLYKILMGISPF